MSMHAVTPLRHRMIEDMNARKLCAGTQRGHIHSCKRFAVFLSRNMKKNSEKCAEMIPKRHFLWICAMSMSG